jgi:hypothetical protein
MNLLKRLNQTLKDFYKMKKVTLEEQQTRIKEMMGINEQMERSPEDITFGSVGDPDVDSESEVEIDEEEGDEVSYKDPKDDYRKLVEIYTRKYGWEISDHIKHVMVSMLCDRDKVMQGGSASQAINANDLGAAVRAADSEVVKHLKELVIARDNFYIEQLKYM